MSENSTLDVPTSLGEMQDDDEFSLLDLFQVIVDNLKLLIIGPLVCGLAALGYSFTITPTFTAKTQFLPPQQQSSAANLLASLGALSGLTGGATGFKSPTDQYIAFMRSARMQDALIERFKLVEKYQVKLKTDAREALAGSVRIVSGRDGLISVEVEDKDPKFAAELANAHVEELSNLLGSFAVTEAQQRRMFFEKQLQITKERFIKADLSLKSSGINSSVLKSSPTTAIEAVARLKSSISVQEVKLGSMRSYLTESSPDFKQALSELTSLKSELAKAEKEDTASQGASDYVARYREYKLQETMLELFVKQFELAKVDESREGAVIQVLDVAEPPERKTRPKKAMIAINATLASGLVLLLFVFIRSFLKNKFQNEEMRLKVSSLSGSWKKALGR